MIFLIANICLLRKVDEIWIGKGDESFGNANKAYILAHSGDSNCNVAMDYGLY